MGGPKDMDLVGLRFLWAYGSYDVATRVRCARDVEPPMHACFHAARVRQFFLFSRETPSSPYPFLIVITISVRVA